MICTTCKRPVCFNCATNNFSKDEKIHKNAHKDAKVESQWKLYCQGKQKKDDKIHHKKLKEWEALFKVWKTHGDTLNPGCLSKKAHMYLYW